jgi:glycosyltransferase involved in cell wall biosynthesis
MTDAALDTPVVSVVVPVLDEEDCLPELHRRVGAALADIPHEIVFVDDGSTDASPAIVEELARREDGIILVELSRNFGMEVAMSAGLDQARGEYVVLMHADLQDPPELVPEMLRVARDGADVVYARRIGRDESWLKRSLATAFYELMAHLARTPYQGQAGDFRLMSRRVVDTLHAMPERRRFLRGMVAWVGYEQVPIEYRRAGRVGGRGASYRALFRLALEALASFSDVPLALAGYFGIATAVVAGVAALVLLVATVAGWLSASLGVWTLIVLLFLGGVQLVSVGILGRYVARVHEQTLQRPLYLVERVVSSQRGTCAASADAPGRSTTGPRMPPSRPPSPA